MTINFDEEEIKQLKKFDEFLEKFADMADNGSDITFFRDLADYELKSGNWTIGNLDLYFDELTFGVILQIKDNILTYTSHIMYTSYDMFESTYDEVEEYEESHNLKSCMSDMKMLLNDCDAYVDYREQLEQLFNEYELS